MGTHAAALGITLVAYIFARRLAHDRQFTFGTGKRGVLAGFSSAIVLLLVALMMACESVQRLITPHAIQYNEAILVAVIGLSVNLLSAFLLRGHEHGHHHGHAHHDHPHDDAENHNHEDHNLKAANLHVVADALTSVLAIVALLAGKMFGWGWMDAAMGIVGAVVITRGSVGLMRETGGILLDRSADEPLITVIRQRLEVDADNRVADLHVWKISSSECACAISIVTHFPRPVEHYRALLSEIDGLAHHTIEVHQCLSDPCLPIEQSLSG